jgi:glycosyltransferase involved in cell wall biosynthesis
VTASIRHDTVVLGVPAYNEVRFIERTLRSIQARTHADFAAVITDNASIDATSDLCADFARADPRFTHVRQPANIGAAANFDFAREASESPLFGWVGARSDGLWRGRLEDACKLGPMRGAAPRRSRVG